MKAESGTFRLSVPPAHGKDPLMSAPTRAQEHAALAQWFAKRGDPVRAQVHEALAREYASSAK